MFARALSARSSLVARSLLTAPRAAIAALPQTSFVRNFNNSPVLKNAAAPATEDAPGPGQLIEKYGSLSFWGMLATIVVTKEVFVVDAEFLLSLEIGAFALTTYVFAGDTIDKWSRDQDAAKSKQFTEANDFMLSMLNQYKLGQTMAQEKPAVLEQYLGEFKAAIANNAKYQTILPQHKARAEVLATLEQIKTKEENAAAAAWKEAVDTAVANVHAAFEADNEALQKEFLTMAINQIGSDKDVDDPVKRLLAAEFAD